MDLRFKSLKYEPNDEVVKQEILGSLQVVHDSAEPPAKQPKQEKKKTALDIVLGPDNPTSEEQSATLSNELNGYFSSKPV